MKPIPYRRHRLLEPDPLEEGLEVEHRTKKAGESV